MARNALYPQPSRQGPIGDPTATALFGGEGAATADRAALARAKALDAQKSDPSRIWQETGWFKDPTGWSFEIDDSGFREMPNALMPPVGARAITRGYPQQYQHDELAKAYPGFMGKARVTLDPEFAKREEADGMVTEGNRLWIDTALPDGPRRSTGVHETQHALDNFEGRRRFPGRDYMQDPREQRAFNVEYRLRMSPEERRRVSPLESLPAALKAYIEKD